MAIKTKLCTPSPTLSWIWKHTLTGSVSRNDLEPTSGVLFCFLEARTCSQENSVWSHHIESKRHDNFLHSVPLPYFRLNLQYPCWSDPPPLSLGLSAQTAEEVSMLTTGYSSLHLQHRSVAACVCKASTGDMDTGQLGVTFRYIVSSRLAWTTGDPTSGKKNSTESKCLSSK